MGELWIKVRTAFFSLCLLIDGAIYSLLNSIYKIYMALASARLLTNGMFIEMANRFYAIIGVAMLFVMAYVVIQGIVNPDNFAKAGGEGSQLLQRIGIAVIGLALVPGVFRIAYTGQDVILSQNIIGKIFLGYEDESNYISHGTVKIDEEELQFDSDGDGEPDQEDINQNDAITSSAGTVAAMSMWQAVFYPSDIDSKESLEQAAEEIECELPASSFVRGAQTLTRWGCGIAIAVSIFTLGASLLGAAALCGAAVAVDKIGTALDGKTINLKQAYGAAAATGNFTVFVTFAGKVAEGDIEYKILFSTIIGAAGAYFFLSFAIDMAVRAIKLVYMQIIAPVPLMLQILPKFKDNFQKWLKTTMSLFMEVFIRLTFVYTVAYLISHLMTIMQGGWLARANLNPVEIFLARAILIIGMLMFAKTAPQFISETLGISSGNLNLGIRKKLAEGGVLSVAAGAAGIGANFLSGTFTNMRNRWREGQKNGHGMIRNLAAGAGGFLTGGLGYAIRSAPQTIMDAKTAQRYRDVVDRTRDSYRRGKEDQANREAKRDERLKELREKYDYDPADREHAEKRSPIRWVTANASRQWQNGWSWIRDEFAAPPETLKPWQMQMEVEAKLKGYNDELTAAALEENDNYKQAVAARQRLDTQYGKRVLAQKLAEEMHANGSLSDEEYNALKNGDPSKLDEFMIKHADAYQEREWKEMRAADDKVKAAKKAATAEEVNKARVNKEGKVYKVMEKFLRENPDFVSKHGDMVIELDDKQQVRLGEYMAKNSGLNFEEGKVDGNYLNTDTDEKDVEVTLENGKKVLIRYRKDEKGNTVKTFDDGVNPPKVIDEIKDGKDIMIAGVRTPMKIKKMDKETFIKSSKVKMEDGKVKAFELAETLGGSVEYALDADTSERVTIKTDASGVETGKIIRGQLPPAELTIEDLGGSSIVEADGKIEVQAKIGTSGEKVKVAVQKSGETITARIADSEPITLDASVGSISLADASTIKVEDLVANLSLGDGDQVVKLDSGESLEVQISDSKVTSCQTVLTGSVSAEKLTGAIGAKPVIDVYATADALSAGESITLSDIVMTKGTDGSVTVSKAADGSKMTITTNATGEKQYTIQKNGTVITAGSEDEAKRSFADRAEVDVGEIEKLKEERRETKLKVFGAGSKTSDVTISPSASGEASFTVRSDTDKDRVKASRVVSGLREGETVKFDLPANQGEVSVTKSGGEVKYTVTDPKTKEASQPMTESEFKEKYKISVSSQEVTDSITDPGTKRVKIAGREFTVTNLDSAGITSHSKEITLKGISGITGPLASSSVGSSITLENGATIRIEPAGKTEGEKRFVYIDDTGASTYTSESELLASHSEISTQTVRGISREEIDKSDKKTATELLKNGLTNGLQNDERLQSALRRIGRNPSSGEKK